MHNVDLMNKIYSEKRKTHYLKMCKRSPGFLHFENISKYEECGKIYPRYNFTYDKKYKDIKIYGVRKKYIDTQGEERISFTPFVEDTDNSTLKKCEGKTIYIYDEYLFNKTINDSLILNRIFMNAVLEIFYNRHEHIADMAEIVRLLS